jgi:nucleoside-diphosphate-sugar epimerase/SAM-dependent methyltransferase/quercetin dioxygenase-like cupin family protein
MKKKIVITGGLGYIGTELCLLYSGYSWFYEIIVIDNRFISERVTQLRKWGIKFIQASILDKESLNSIISDADIIYHLAGITDVAYVKNDSLGNDDEIIKVGVEGTRNIIDYSKDDVKIIFPSSHVVYEGYNEALNLIDETKKVKPVLTYSKSKYESERDLINSGKNYVILRLASVHGYSLDTMRIGIMPNLFSKLSSQNKQIKLFGGGKQLKCLVNIKDVTRAFMFCGEELEIKNEVFHVCNENFTVKEVALICKKFSKKLKLIETDDEIPNLGYSLNGEKLKKYGFEYRYKLENSIQDMISNWSEKDIRKELEYTYSGKDNYIDERGEISNYELTEPINLIGHITSKPGSVRANHFHPIQEQKCLLIKGEYISITKDLLDEDSLIESLIIKEGDLSVIKPNVAHTMVFTKDSIFLNLVRGEREHKNYGITHTIPYTLVDDKFKKQLLGNYVCNCKVCNSKNIVPLLRLGKSPLANNLISDQSETFSTYLLEVNYCEDCFNCQLSYHVDPKMMFDHYLYRSSTAKKFVEHFDEAAKKYITAYGLDGDSLIVDIGSNDGIGIRYFNDKNINVIGVEPAKNLAELSNSNGIKTINSYFDEGLTDNIINEHGNADLVLASNVFAHSDNLFGIAENAIRLLKKDGTFIIEFQYFVDNLKNGDFDNIYHEHYNYWNLHSLKVFFDKLGFPISKVERIDTHGGSIRAYINKNKKIDDDSLEIILSEEKDFGVNNYKKLYQYAEDIIRKRKEALIKINNFKKEGKRIIGYGAPAKATTLLNFFRIDSSHIDYIIEDNPLKANKIIPGTGIKIISKEELSITPDIVIVFAWNFYDSIVENNKNLIEKGTEFISIKSLFETTYKFKK